MDIFYVKHSAIIVPEYEIGDALGLESSLSVWDKYTYSHRPIGFVYDEDEKTLYLPRGIDVGYVAHALDRKPFIDRGHDEYKRAGIRLQTPPKNDLQRKSIAFLTGKMEFGYTSKTSQLALTLSTGAGKTYCTIASLSVLNKLPIIITHNNNIKGQWIDAFVEHTDVDERSICDINGSAIIDRLMKNEKLRKKYRVYVVNRRTLASYAKRNSWDKIGEFFKEMEFGIKVYDEAHIEFNTILNTDLHTNTWKSIYLTANLERSDRDENRVYELCFKNVHSYGEISNELLKKHMVYISVMFDSKPSYNDRVGLKTIRGLNIPKYTEYLMNNEEFRNVLKEVVPKLVGIIKTKGDGRVVTMSSTIDSTQIMEELMRNMYPDRLVKQYNSTLTEQEKEDIITNTDIITTTSKSLGTGSNIEGMQLLMNFEPYSSKVTANQVSGRLRPLSSGNRTLYVEFVDVGFPEIKRMHDRRKPTLKKKAVRVATMRMDN